MSVFEKKKSLTILMMNDMILPLGTISILLCIFLILATTDSYKRAKGGGDKE
jgi:hypothetical protein